MRGLLLLSDPKHPRIRPEDFVREGTKHHIKIHWEEAAENGPLLSSLQLRLYRLRRHCDWVCVMAEGEMCAQAVILAAQLPVDRLVLMDGALFENRPSDRLHRRLRSFARRNLSLITAEVIAVGMDNAAFRRLSSGLGYHCAGLLRVRDGAELWQKHETFLTAPFDTLAD